MNLKEVERLCNANYDRGGDYVLVMMTAEERERNFCGEQNNQGKKKLYDYMKDITQKRKYLRSIKVDPAEWIASHTPAFTK